MKHLDLAKRIAATSNHRKSRHGAVLVRGGSILNFSKNSTRFTRFGQRFIPYDQTWRRPHHAEIGCILGMPRSVTKGATIYVARVSKRGETKNSKPCSICQAVLRHVGIKKVIYTTDGSDHECLKLTQREKQNDG